MQNRLDRLQDRAAERIAKDVMVKLDLKKIEAPHFSAFLRPGTPALVVLNEEVVPSIYWQPGPPRLQPPQRAQEHQAKAAARQGTFALQCHTPRLTAQTVIAALEYPVDYQAFEAAVIEPDDVERVPPNVDTDYRDRSLSYCCRHGVLLVW